MVYSYIEFEEILRYGVSEQYLKVALNRYRKGESTAWENVKDTKDARKVLVNLDSIPKTTRKKYNIPTGIEYIQQKQREEIEAYEKALIDAKRETEENCKRQKSYQLNKEKRDVYNAYHNDWLQYVSIYRERFAYNPKRQDELAIQHAKDHAFWLKMVEVTGTKYKTFYGKPKEAFVYYRELCKELKLTSQIESISYFTRKLKDLRETLVKGQSIVDLIADKAMRPRTEKKTNEFHVSLAFSILSNPKVYPYRVATDIINHHCEIEGQPTITESWIKTLLAKDNILKTAINKYRYGQKYFEDNSLPHAVRNVTPYPGNVWMIDGTPIQFYCWNQSRTKTVRLNLFAVIDVCSRKIVGFDVAYSEDKYNVLKALKIAVLSEGHLPREIVSDNFSANKTDEIMSLKKQMEGMGILWRHSKVGNAKDKSYIERFFGAFQSVECALYDDYIGEGITSKRLNARPNAEYLAKVAKEKGLPTYTEMVSRINRMIAKYNERTKSKKQSPNEVYKLLPKPNIKDMDMVKTSLMFWTKTTYTVRRGMIKITVRHVQHTYEIHDHSLKMRLQGKKITVRYDKDDLDTIMLFDDYDQPICECKKALKINIGEVDRTDEDVLKTYSTVAKQKSYSQYIDKYRDDIMDKGLQVINKDTLEIAHPLSLDKNQVNSQESKQLMELFNHLNVISSDKEENQEYTPIATIAQKGVTTDVREKLLQKKKPSEKGSLEVINQD